LFDVVVEIVFYFKSFKNTYKQYVFYFLKFIFIISILKRLKIYIKIIFKNQNLKKYMASHIFKQRWLWKFLNLMDMEVKGKKFLL